ncbi:MAG: hypothetical protein ACRC8B_06270 [Aeromonas sobria]
MTGYTEKAIKEKVKQGKLIEGVHYGKAPDKKIIINWRRFEDWMCGK